MALGSAWPLLGATLWAAGRLLPLGPAAGAAATVRCRAAALAGDFTAGLGLAVAIDLLPGLEGVLFGLAITCLLDALLVVSAGLSACISDCANFPAVDFSIEPTPRLLLEPAFGEATLDPALLAVLATALFFVDFVTVTFMISSLSRTCPKCHFGRTVHDVQSSLDILPFSAFDLP